MLINRILVGDAALDAQCPEALMYEAQSGQLRLLGVEYIVLADAWNAANPEPPTLMGQASITRPAQSVMRGLHGRRGGA